MLWAGFTVLVLERATVDDIDWLAVVLSDPCASLSEVFKCLALHVLQKQSQTCLHITGLCLESQYREISYFISVVLHELEVVHMTYNVDHNRHF